MEYEKVVNDTKTKDNWLYSERFHEDKYNLKGRYYNIINEYRVERDYSNYR